MFWHATKTGENDATIDSFRSMGAYVHADPRFPNKGQRHGFYVWTSLEEAQYYALHECRDLCGNPAIVQLQVACDASQWDFDYELGVGSVIKAFELLEPELLETDFSKVQFPGLGMYRTPEHVRVGKAEDCDLYFGFTNLVESKWSLEIHYGRNLRNLSGGALYKQIIADHIRGLYPDKFNAVLSQLIADACATNRATAFKYIGSAALPISGIDIIKDEMWQPVSHFSREQMVDRAAPLVSQALTQT